MKRFSDRSRSTLRVSSDHRGGDSTIAPLSCGTTVRAIYDLFHRGVTNALVEISGPVHGNRACTLLYLSRGVKLLAERAANMALDCVAYLAEAGGNSADKLPFGGKTLQRGAFSPCQPANVAIEIQPIRSGRCSDRSTGQVQVGHKAVLTISPMTTWPIGL